MIFHASVPADDPERVAKVLGELLGGYSVPFKAWPGAYVARPEGNDEQDLTSIEVYPRHTPQVPGKKDDEQCQIGNDEHPSQYGCFHLAISTPLSIDEIVKIGQREGWRAKHFSRNGLFEVVEFWLENSLMIEFFPPEMAAHYRAMRKTSPHRKVVTPA